MNFMMEILFGMLFIPCLIDADAIKSNTNFNEQCQALKCNPSTETCRLKLNCDDSNQNDVSKCIYCALKTDLNQNTISNNLLASSIFKQQQKQPLAPRLLARSGGAKLITSNPDNTISSSAVSAAVNSTNRIFDELSYDDYYEYDDDEISDKSEFGEEDEYLDDYLEPLDSLMQDIKPIRKIGICPKVVEVTGNCDSSKIVQSDCRFDTDCPADRKCCEAACGKRVCSLPISTIGSVCPLSFQCTLNCRLGYRTDSNGCLLCECQSCPSMERCNKNCPAGYLKDLFGCDICECNDRCPPFSCSILCPINVGFAKSADGCPICRCATTESQPTQYVSSCQSDVHCPPGFRCLNDARNVPMCQAVPALIGPPLPTQQCPNNLAIICNLQCPNGNYLLDSNGCPICACSSDPLISRIGRPPNGCPLIQCATICKDAGYKFDENGCPTCECASVNTNDMMPKPNFECPRVMCRMFCLHGFSRDENGCEICKCNDSPQPCPVYKCEKTCLNGYRKDYSGCLTCTCADDESKLIIDDGCSPMKCDLECKYGFERDQAGCELCSCNRCPLYSCRLFCMYGFKKNNDSCEICECDWTPISENIPCSARIPCTDNHVCNLNLNLCELVNPDKVNWFVYDFDIETEYFNDQKFVLAFKNGLINNIASKYALEPTQITVSSVDKDGMTSFQIMPYFNQDMNDFQKKIDAIDNDLNSLEFHTVLPSVARRIENHKDNLYDSKWNRYVKKNSHSILYIIALVIGLVALIAIGICIIIFRRRVKYPGRSESKTPIYDTPYHQAPTDDDLYHAVHAPDGTAYVVVESEDIQSPNDKRALV